MLQTTTILSLTLALVSTGNLEPRIINGQFATRNQFPFIVSLRTRVDDRHFCAGTLLTSSWILTAAHCLEKNYEAKDLVVVSGAVNLADGGACRTSVEKIIPHPNVTADIALLKQNIDWNYVRCSTIGYLLGKHSVIRPINIDQIHANLQVKIAGWGSQSRSDPKNNADELKYTKLWTTESDKFCTNDQTVFCAKVLDGGAACGNDYGGPVTYGEGKNARLVGIVTQSSSECAAPGQSERFTRVFSFNIWIYEHTSSNINGFEILLSVANSVADSVGSFGNSIHGTISKISNFIHLVG